MGSLKIETSNDYGFSMTAKRTHEYLRDRLGAQQSDSQNGFLKTVRERKLELVRAAKARRPFSAVVEDATLAAPPRGFLANLAFHRERGNYGLIAEIKRASQALVSSAMTFILRRSPAPAPTAVLPACPWSPTRPFSTGPTTTSLPRAPRWTCL